MQSAVIQFSVDDGLVAGEKYNVYAGVDAAGKPVGIDFSKPLNAAPLALLAGVGPHPGRLGAARYAVGRGDPKKGLSRAAAGRSLAPGRPAVSFRTPPQFYFGEFTVAARPVSRGGDEQASGTPTKAITINSAPRSPTGVTLQSFDAGNDQVVIAMTPPPQLG